MTISVEAIAEAIGAKPIELHTSVSGFSIDSRTINPGDCFFALRGPSNDGHDYIQKLPEKGAALAVVERLCDVKIPQLVVPDTLRALQQLAAWTRQRWAGTVVGVTGSAGKTTTKDAIASLLAVQFRTGRTIGNYNNHFGLPLSILRLPDDCRVAVLELGMNHAGEIRDLAAIAKPQIGVVTNVGWAHAEFFEDGIEGIARAKRELIEALPPAGIAVLNADDEHVRDFVKVHAGRTILYGFSEDAEVRAEDFRTCKSYAHFRCLGVEFETPLAGRHGVSNVLAAIATARALNIAPEHLQDAVKTLAVGKMRGERFERDGITVINDSYNANPEAVRSMLELLRGVPGRRKIAVLGEMLELGREAGTLHRGIGRLAAEAGIDALVGIRGAASFMVEEAREAGMSGSAAVFFQSPEEAGIFLRSYLRAGDVVLFKGSRGVAVEKAIGPAFGEPIGNGMKAG
ncbi:MAG TPA: UDP-N-acetylmuramoyl-tripeptide--D-alanyl-D-alanine ligase [Bryobacteraceae bacterium]|jgi:UDP-N-acetylmuramoyl-tripeptide--D-alanyl-D-alanine ligase|nr:UDP-N-acetylmuramoyl-tripeptide--D-alanyl-D-alanine ligase [Bryobacteraceae bacterium]